MSTVTGGDAYGAPPPSQAPAGLGRGSAAAAAAYPQARTLYAFVGQDGSELSFSEGEFISVVAQEGEWWTGILRGRTGLFPANYVQAREKKEFFLCSSPFLTCFVFS